FVVLAMMGKIEIPLAVRHPPGVPQIAVEARMEYRGVARGGHVEPDWTLRGSGEGPGGGINVCGAGGECAVGLLGCQLLLEALGGPLVPLLRQAERAGQRRIALLRHGSGAVFSL